MLYREWSRTDQENKIIFKNADWSHVQRQAGHMSRDAGLSHVLYSGRLVTCIETGWSQEEWQAGHIYTDRLFTCIETYWSHV